MTTYMMYMICVNYISNQWFSQDFKIDEMRSKAKILKKKYSITNNNNLLLCYMNVLRRSMVTSLF